MWIIDASYSYSIGYRWSRIAIKNFPCNTSPISNINIAHLTREFVGNLMEFIFPHLLRSYDTRAKLSQLFVQIFTSRLFNSLADLSPELVTWSVNGDASWRGFAAGATPFGFARSKIWINFNDRAPLVTASHCFEHRCWRDAMAPFFFLVYPQLNVRDSSLCNR